MEGSGCGLIYYTATCLELFIKIAEILSEDTVSADIQTGHLSNTSYQIK
jgi:hypothetical protein